MKTFHWKAPQMSSITPAITLVALPSEECHHLPAKQHKAEQGLWGWWLSLWLLQFPPCEFLCFWHPLSVTLTLWSQRNRLPLSSVEKGTETWRKRPWGSEAMTPQEGVHSARSLHASLLRVCHGTQPEHPQLTGCLGAGGPPGWGCPVHLLSACSCPAAACDAAAWASLLDRVGAGCDCCCLAQS